MRRASVSIPSNIAEGSGRGGNPELIRFLRIAAGSAYEAESQLLLAYDLGYLQKDIYEQLEKESIEIKRMLAGLVQNLESRQSKP